MQFKGDSRFARGIRSVPRHFLTILAGFLLFNCLRTNFGARNKLTTGLTLDCESLLLREYNDRARTCFKTGLCKGTLEISIAGRG